MNVLLIGGSGSLINNLIIKLNKEGHRLYLLTGNKYKQAPYQKVFERYDFTYDCGSLNEIFESVNPDLTIYMGAFDTNYRWSEEKKESIKYTTGLMNILMAYAMSSEGRFIYLSSDEVYSGNYEQNIWEDEPLTPEGFRSMVLAQGEELCESYRAYRGRDIVTLRLDHLYSIPRERKDVDNICARMCLEVLEHSTITITEGSRFSLLYETDAIEFIYRLIDCKEHKYHIYNLASSVEISELDIAGIIQKAMGWEIEILTREEEGVRRVLANQLLDSEFGNPFCCEVNAIINKMVAYMKKNRYAFLTGEDVKQPFWKRVVEASGWFIKATIPFLENLVCFFPFYFMNLYLAEGSIFSKLDFFLLYVLLFAIVYGQQQATFSAVLAVIGYCVSQMSERSGFEVMLDSNTYIWIAQLFILGLVVGYMRDQLSKIKSENIEEREFLSEQLNDIQDINSSNVRVKDALETQIVNQNDSVGKIYSITSALDQYSPEEVLFYAAEILGKLMRSKDVAIYTISSAEYARLFSYTSMKAKSMGNSIRYRELGEVFDTLQERKVYINRKMDERYPLMANAIYDNDEMQMMVFVWGLSWEQMTLGQANQLTIISSLIQNAVIRANKYLAALEEERYVEESR
ncbi:MAG: NAD(P)-dependent oxidoreductase, partial [Lachnospiraceae bacterium]|nr:NAD(P)-dependent oxidoreductase [Lachnospiraceae bacterium]